MNSWFPEYRTKCILILIGTVRIPAYEREINAAIFTFTMANGHFLATIHTLYCRPPGRDRLLAACRGVLMSIRRLISGGCHGLIEKAISIAKHRAANFFIFLILEAVPIGDGMQIGEKNFCLARKKLAGILTNFKSF